MVLGVRCLGLAWLLHSAAAVPQSYSTRSRSDCFELKENSLKLKDNNVDKYLSVSSLEECQKECDLTFLNCKSLAYNSDRGDISEANCLLSRQDLQTLNLRDNRDFEYDRKYSFYERKSSLDCEQRSDRGFVQERSSNYIEGNSRCFVLAISNTRVVDRLVRERIRTKDRMQCEEECLRANSFTCRGFNYRHSAGSSLYSENCELTSQDTYGVTVRDTVFTRDADTDFFERTSFSNQCDGTLGRTINDNWSSVNRYGTSVYPNRNRISTRDNFWTDSRSRINDDNRYGYGNNYNNYYYNNNYNRGDCFRFYRRESRLDSRVVRERLRVRDLQACKDACLRSRNYMCKTLAFSYASTWLSNDNCYLSEMRATSLSQYDIVYDRSFDIQALDETSRDCYGSSGDQPYNPPYDRPYDPPYDSPYGREDRYVTASGLQCYRGGCRVERVGQFYFCETDMNGGWDYCCRPDDYCKQSTSSYPLRWCYVGVHDKDQWRNCNMNSYGGGRSRSYLKEESPDSSKKLKDPEIGDVTSKLNPGQKIEVKDISELG